MQLGDLILRSLVRARERTTSLAAAVDDAELVKQHSSLLSPLSWHLAHIGNQEELWILRNLGGREPMRPEIDPLYDSYRHDTDTRARLALLPPDEARRYTHEVRERALDLLAQPRWQEAELGRDGFVFGMIAQHEQQHAETMLIIHQFRPAEPKLLRPPPPAPADAGALPAEVFVPGGPFTMGTSTEAWALDNERPAHEVDVAGFWLDTVPVTNDAYAEFIADGGYDEPRWWSEAGWSRRMRADLHAPRYWTRDGSRWLRRRFGLIEPVPREEPVMHVCSYEAEAYAAWKGRRLPTEAEWEKAARFDPVSGRSRRYPWGDEDPAARHANLGQRGLQPAPAGSYPDGAAPCGARQLIGDVWEWVSSDFLPYPGFSPWPYREYSGNFFGSTFKVLRGGSFATDPVACRGTFRNWDYPFRRHAFAGFRTARDGDL